MALASQRRSLLRQAVIYIWMFALFLYWAGSVSDLTKSQSLPLLYTCTQHWTKELRHVISKCWKESCIIKTCPLFHSDTVIAFFFPPPLTFYILISCNLYSISDSYNNQITEVLFCSPSDSMLHFHSYLLYFYHFPLSSKIWNPEIGSSWNILLCIIFPIIWYNWLT